MTPNDFDDERAEGRVGALLFQQDLRHLGVKAWLRKSTVSGPVQSAYFQFVERRTSLAVGDLVCVCEGPTYPIPLYRVTRQEQRNSNPVLWNHLEAAGTADPTRPDAS